MFRDSASHVRDLAMRQARRASARAGDELLSLPVAAAIAYGRLVGDATEVGNTAELQAQLERIALALSAVATLQTSPSSDGPLVRRNDLSRAIETLERAGVAFAS